MNTLKNVIDQCCAQGTAEEARNRLYAVLGIPERLPKPMPRHYLIRRFEPQTHEGAIEVPKASRQIPNRGVILACGDNCLIPIGTEVIFAPIAGVSFISVEENSPTLFIYHEEEILTTLEK